MAVTYKWSQLYVVRYYGVAGSYQLIYDLSLYDVLFNELSEFLRTFEKVVEGVRRKSVGILIFLSSV